MFSKQKRQKQPEKSVSLEDKKFEAELRDFYSREVREADERHPVTENQIKSAMKAFTKNRKGRENK